MEEWRNPLNVAHTTGVQAQNTGVQAQNTGEPPQINLGWFIGSANDELIRPSA